MKTKSLLSRLAERSVWVVEWKALLSRIKFSLSQCIPPISTSPTNRPTDRPDRPNPLPLLPILQYTPAIHLTIHHRTRLFPPVVALQRPQPTLQSSQRAPRFTYFGVRLTDNNVSTPVFDEWLHYQERSIVKLTFRYYVL